MPIIKIVSCTRGKKEDTELYKSLKTHRVQYEARWFENNTETLPKCYNIAIREYKDYVCKPVLVFVHDDVSIDDAWFGEKILEYSKTFDIMGVAGSTKINMKTGIVAWHLSGDPTSMFGSVMHKKNGVYWMVDFSRGRSIPHRVATIDGLLMAFTHDAYGKIQFDERFEFDFYDMDICMSAYKNNLSVGVVPIQVCHQSIGDGINTDAYKITQDVFLEKWRQ